MTEKIVISHFYLLFEIICFTFPVKKAYPNPYSLKLTGFSALGNKNIILLNRNPIYTLKNLIITSPDRGGGWMI